MYFLLSSRRTLILLCSKSLWSLSPLTTCTFITRLASFLASHGIWVGFICVSRVATPTKIVPYIGTIFYTLAKAAFFVLWLVCFFVVLYETSAFLVQFLGLCLTSFCDHMRSAAWKKVAWVCNVLKLSMVSAAFTCRKVCSLLLVLSRMLIYLVFHHNTSYWVWLSGLALRHWRHDWFLDVQCGLN